MYVSVCIVAFLYMLTFPSPDVVMFVCMYVPRTQMKTRGDCSSTATKTNAMNYCYKKCDEVLLRVTSMARLSS